MNVKSARNAAEFVRCCSFDQKGRLEVAIVPGHEARFYEVTFCRNGKVVVKNCYNPDEGEVCKGHRFGLCFHALAALINAADRKKLRLVFCKTKERAERIQRTGGTLVEVLSNASNKGGWIVYRKKIEKKIKKS